MRLSRALTLALIGAGWGLPVLAHGVALEHRRVSSVEVWARFDSGEPMAQAQVLVYAPDNPTEAWQQGTTDDQGRFSFVPDETLTGNWEVMVRQAGHGAIATVPVAAPDLDAAPETDPGPALGTATGTAAASNSLISPRNNLSPVQRGITIGAVIWGLIGTGLFFARGKR